MKKYKVYITIEAENLQEVETKLDEVIQLELKESGTVANLFHVDKVS